MILFMEAGMKRQCVSGRNKCSAFILLMLLVGMGCKQEPQKAPVPAPEVEVIKVAPATIPAVFPFVAQTSSSHQVEIMTRVSGFLDKIIYKEGGLVRAGDVLFQIDPKPLEAQVKAAEAEVEVRESQLWTASANLKRIRPLAEQKAASLSDLDSATGNVKAAEAALHGAKANLEKARLDLGYAAIKSPVTGISGQALVREGAFVASGSSSAKLTYVATVDPIWVEFSVSQNQMTSLQEQIRQGILVPPPDKKYTVELELSDGSRYPHTGALNFVDPSFNKETGTFMLRAEIANPESDLQPGMFVKALLGGLTRPNVIVVPQKAVVQTGNGHVVYVVNEKGVAEVRPVMTGEWVGQDWIINHGLHAGDQVVVAGFMRLGPGGMPVKIVAAGQNHQSALLSATPKQ